MPFFCFIIKNKKKLIFLFTAFSIVFSIFYFYYYTLFPLSVACKKAFSSKDKTAIFIISNRSNKKINLIYIYAECDCSFDMPFHGIILPGSNFCLPIKIKDYEHLDNKETITILTNLFFQRKLKINLCFDEKKRHATQKNFFIHVKNFFLHYPTEKVRCPAVFFYRPGCVQCMARQKILRSLENKYKFFYVKELELTEKNNIYLAEQIGEKLNIPFDDRLKTPMLIIGNTYYLKDDIKLKSVEEILIPYINNKDVLPSPWEDLKKIDIRTNFYQYMEKLPLLSIIFAGLIDGINPCAFSTLILFLSFMTVLKRTNREKIIIGTVFTFAIFISYMLIGSGLLNSMRFILHIKIISSILYIGIAVFTIIVGIISFKDAFYARAGKIDKINLQLSKKAKIKIQRLVSTQSKKTGIIISTFIIGCGISMLELGCTGQIYLPVIAYIIQNNYMNKRGWFYLLLYNIAFTLPLIIVFILYLNGIEFIVFKKILMGNVTLLKILLGLVFLLIGGFMLWKAISYISFLS